MYRLTHCHVKEPEGWRAISAQSKTIKYLTDTYQQVRLYVQSELAGGKTHTIDLHEVLRNISEAQQLLTIDNWVVDVDPSMLNSPSSSTTLDRVGMMRVGELWDYPVSVKMGNSAYGADTPVPIGLVKDMAITAKDIADVGYISELADTTLIAINGRICKTERSGDTLFVKDANRYLGGVEQSISVISLRELGGLTTIGITESNAIEIIRSSGDRLADKSRVRVVSGVDLANKTVLLVIDGYPHFLDGTLQVYDGNNVILHIDHNRMCKRRLADSVATESTSSGMNSDTTGIDIDDFDAIEYLTGTTSFLAILDGVDINKHSHPAGRTDILGLYTSSYPPQGILIAEDGRMLDYHIEGTDGHYTSVITTNNNKHTYLHDNSKDIEGGKATATEIQSASMDFVDATFVDLYTTIKYP